jgi:hypothetical protein
MIENNDLSELAAAVRAIAHGGTSGPTGLEMLTMAIVGDGAFARDNLAQAIRDAGESIERGLLALADALQGRAVP